MCFSNKSSLAKLGEHLSCIRRRPIQKVCGQGNFRKHRSILLLRNLNQSLLLNNLVCLTFQFLCLTFQFQGMTFQFQGMNNTNLALNIDLGLLLLYKVNVELLLGALKQVVHILLTLVE